MAALTMDTELACRLSHASNLAYAIPDIGQNFKPYPELNNDLTAAGLSPTGCTFFRPTAMDNINACYYGVNTNNEAILAFRGTQPPTLIFQDPEKFFQVVVDDWLNDANAALVTGGDLPGKVHRGFLASLDTLWPRLIQFLQSTHDKTKPLYVTGHSKGGGLAFLAGYRLWKNSFEPTATYTFAAPRVGDAGFAALFDDKLKSKTWRLEYRDDIVPHLPPHTAAWTFFLQGLKLVNFKIPFGTAQVDPRLSRLVDRIEKLKAEGFANYVSAGTLVFINWDEPPKEEPDSPNLNRQRELHLAEKILAGQVIEIITDHFLDHGYMPFMCQS
jgi:triacylglycerol lipase